MQKISAPLDDEGYKQNANRLQEIGTTALGSLTDEVILELLAERRLLTKENDLYESIRDEQAKRVAELTAEEQALERELEELNISITPDKDDDTLLKLIQHRKELEAKLETLGAEERKLAAKPAREEEIPGKEQEVIVAVQDSSEDDVVSPIKESASDTEEVKTRAETVPSPEAGPLLSEESASEEKTKKGKVSDALIGSEGIRGVSSQEAENYLKFLQSNPEEALAQLETLPEYLRKDKPFML